MKELLEEQRKVQKCIQDFISSRERLISGRKRIQQIREIINKKGFEIEPYARGTREKWKRRNMNPRKWLSMSVKDKRKIIANLYECGMITRAFDKEYAMDVALFIKYFDEIFATNLEAHDKKANMALVIQGEVSCGKSSIVQHCVRDIGKFFSGIDLRRMEDAMEVINYSKRRNIPEKIIVIDDIDCARKALIPLISKMWNGTQGWRGVSLLDRCMMNCSIIYPIILICSKTMEHDLSSVTFFRMGRPLKKDIARILRESCDISKNASTYIASAAPNVGSAISMANAGIRTRYDNRTTYTEKLRAIYSGMSSGEIPCAHANFRIFATYAQAMSQLFPKNIEDVSDLSDFLSFSDAIKGDNEVNMENVSFAYFENYFKQKKIEKGSYLRLNSRFIAEGISKGNSERMKLISAKKRPLREAICG